MPSTMSGSCSFRRLLFHDKETEPLMPVATATPMT